MKRLQDSLLVLLCLFFLAGTAQARSPVPIVNLENEPIATISGKPLTLADVKTALALAGVAKGWNIAETAPGHAIGTLVVRNKHTIQVDIAYTEKSMSFHYKDSVNMKYGLDDAGSPVIHPFYINWVRDLLKTLKVELARL